VLTVPLARRLRRLPSATARALRSVVAAPRGRPDPVHGLALALAVLGPLAAGQASGHAAEGTIAAFGALNSVLADLGGPARRRLAAAAGAAALNAGALAVGCLVADPAWLTVLAIGLLVPLLSAAGAVAPWAPTLSFLATIMLLVGAGLPEGDIAERGVAALAGGAWGVVVLAALMAGGLYARGGAVAGVRPGQRLSHALRFGVATAGALALAAALGLERGYWLGLTIAVVLHPSLDPTLERTIHRVLGTVVGAALGAAVIASVEDAWALIAIITVLLGITGALLTYHYGLGVIALTAGVLTLLDLGHPGSFDIVDERIANTLLGAAIAILVLILWPRRAGPTPAAASAPRGA
jgi:uncharacterized membrane protein YccC